jgi:hypothetical protein
MKKNKNKIEPIVDKMVLKVEINLLYLFNLIENISMYDKHDIAVIHWN